MSDAALGPIAVLQSSMESRMSRSVEVHESLLLLQGLLEDVAEQLAQPSRADRRAASLKLQRISAIASTLAATIHSPRQ